MRFARLSIFVFAAAIQAQEPVAPPKSEPAKPPAEPARPPDAEAEKEKKPDGVNGSATGHMQPEPEPKLLRLQKAKTPASANYPMQYLLLVAEAMKSFQARDFAGAISYADRADALLEKPTVWTVNVRGAVAIEQLKFEEGKKLCLEALRMDPDFFPAKFNLCEIPFLQGRYADARAGWTALHERMVNEDPTSELLTYRIFLTYLLEGDKVHAKDWLDKLPFPSQTPAYQYAHAAWERENGNQKKWEEWIQSAEFIWPQVKRANFVDVLVQLKWLRPDDFSER